MSDLITRLRRRAHLSEFRICGEAADALEAAEQERDRASRGYKQICEERQVDLQDRRAATRKFGPRAFSDA